MLLPRASDRSSLLISANASPAALTHHPLVHVAQVSLSAIDR